jgi:hypothetical protein
MAVTMKNAVFWDVIPCSCCKNRRVGRTYLLHHLGEKNQRANNVSSNWQLKHTAKKHWLYEKGSKSMLVSEEYIIPIFRLEYPD